MSPWNRRSPPLVPKAKLEIFVLENKVQNVVERVVSLSRTGQVGDGKIVVLPVEEAVRVRTGETGAKAIF